MAENGETDEVNDFTFNDSVAFEVDDEDETMDDEANDPDIEAIQARVREMEEEAEKLKEMHNEVEKQMNLSGSAITSPLSVSLEEKLEADGRSIYVGNVDYSATAEELEAHFHGCGSVNRVTILCDKFSGHPKGFAYIEFADKDAVHTAEALDESLFKGRQIKVSIKRTNRPGISTTNRPPRRPHSRPRAARHYGGGGGGGGGYYGSSPPYYGGRPRGRGFRPRRGSWYSPY